MKWGGARETGPLFVFAGWVALQAATVARHEPWRGETQAWLVARELGPWEIFWSQAAYEGTPALWHLLLAPFAQAGLPVAAMGWIHLLIAGSAAWAVLRHAPFALLTRALLVFSFYLGFEYSVVARNYALAVAALFWIAATYAERNRRPLRHALLVALLANSCLHGWAGAAALVALWIQERIRGAGSRGAVRRAGPRIMAGVAVAAAGVIAAVVQLIPKTWGAPGSRLSDVVVPFQPLSALRAVGNAFWLPLEPYADPKLLGLAGLAAIAVIAHRLKPAPRVLTFLAVTLGALLPLHLFIAGALPRWAGFFLLYPVFALWIVHASEGARRARSPVFAIRVLQVSLALSCLQGFAAHYRDLTGEFAGAKRAAAFLAESGLEGTPLITRDFDATKGILAFLPGRPLWAAEAGREVSVSGPWQRVARRPSLEAALAGAERAYVGYGRMTFVFPRREPGAAALGLRLVHETPGPLVGQHEGDESFAIYVR